MVTSIVLLSMIVPSRHTGIGAWVNSKMYISQLYNIITCHARVFYENNRMNLDLLEHPPVVGGENKHRIHGKLGIQLNSVFRVCYIITSIDRCRRDPGYVQYHRNNYMLS